MTRRRFRLWAACVVLVATAISAESVFAQAGGGGQQGGQSTTNIAGIEVDAGGVLRMNVVVDRGWALMKRRIAEARSTLPREIARPSPLRKVSLNRLEAAAQERLARGEAPTDEMLHLAGLTRIQYVFFYPETNDIVLAGPAEGWMVDPTGRVRGAFSGKPLIRLEDLVVALRAFPPGAQATPVISCSIDPTREGLAKMQAFLSSIGTQLGAPRSAREKRQIAERIAGGLRESLGMQIITVRGVPADTHFGQVLVEADYRMKLIGIGLEDPPRVDLKSYVELSSRSSHSRNAMQRWFFVPEYECVRVTEDKLAMELVGDGVKLVGADEMVTADGSRVASAASDRAGKQFVLGFTAKYAELAKNVPVYAQLRNVIDLAVAAAFIQQQDYYGQAGWMMEVFGEESVFAVQTVAAPERVESAVAAHWNGNRLMTPIGGGVRIEAAKALAAANLLTDNQEQLQRQRDETRIDRLADGEWWWD